METGGNASEPTVVLVPGVSSSYGNGWNKLWKFFLELFLIFIIEIVISLPFSIASWATGQPNTYSAVDFIGIVYSILIAAPVGYGVWYAYLKGARGEKPEVKDVFAAFKNYWNAILAYILTAAIVLIGFVLLIVPGIIFACKLAFVPFLIVEQKMEVIEAVKTSWQMTNGHAFTVFLIYLLAIPITIAGLICLGVGVIVSSMWISLATASLYHAVSLQRSPVTPAAV